MIYVDIPQRSGLTTFVRDRRILLVMASFLTSEDLVIREAVEDIGLIAISSLGGTIRIACRKAQTSEKQALDRILQIISRGR